MSRIKFGTDGWRAVISDDFTFENVKIVAQAIADYVKSQKKKIKNKNSEVFGRKYALVVGYDTRFLSEKYGELIACVLAANGIKTLLAARPTPTPSVSFSIRKGRFFGGVMVTASHNPARYNGIKYKCYFGGSADSGVTDKIESLLYRSKVRFMDKKQAIAKKLLKIADIVPPHLAAIKKYARLGLLKKTGFKILIDSMNGAGAKYIEGLLQGTNNKVTTINGSRDAYFGGRAPEPNESILESTGKIVKKGRFAVGLATDGDADRLGVMLPSGKVLSGHKVMTLLLLYMLEDRRMKGGVVQTICGTALIDKISRAYGIKTYETSVGFKYIARVINEKDVLVGGEETGGVAVKGWLPERDGILSAILILEMMAKRKQGLMEILKGIDASYGTYVYKRLDLRLSPDKKKRLLSALKKKPFRKILEKSVVTIKSFDGFKFILRDGSWLMLRPSGTEPKLRIYSEARNDKEALRLIEFGRKFALKI